MPRWITEDPTTVYCLLGVIAFGLGAAFWIKQDKRYLYGILGVAGLALLIALTDYFIVTDYEKMVIQVKEIARAVKDGDAGRIAAGVTGKFQYHTRLTDAGARDRFRKLAEPHLKGGGVSSLEVWDFAPGPKPISREARKGEINFMAKLHGTEVDQPFFRCVAEFELEPDGAWRMSRFRLLPPQESPTSMDANEWVPSW